MIFPPTSPPTTSLSLQLYNAEKLHETRFLIHSTNNPQWCLVIAGISDFARPAEKLSLTQNAALMGTGAIWTRWCMIIKPRNVLYVQSECQHSVLC